MDFHIYKLGDGYWTRVGSVTSLAVLGACGAAWLWGELAVYHSIYVQASGAGIVLAITVFLSYWLFGVNHRAVEFCIATEGELKKVNWSTRKEITSSTWVVIAVSAAISVILFVVDIFFKEIFTMCGVLVGNSAILEWIRSIFGG